MQALLRDLNRLYREVPALHATDSRPEGFRWLVEDDWQNSVYAFLRHLPGEKPVLVVVNMTPMPRWNYRIGVPQPGPWREVLNSDAGDYGGTGLGNGGAVHARGEAFGGEPACVEIVVPPLAALVFTAD